MSEEEEHELIDEIEKPYTDEIEREQEEYIQDESYLPPKEYQQPPSVYRKTIVVKDETGRQEPITSPKQLYVMRERARQQAIKQERERGRFIPSYFQQVFAVKVYRSRGSRKDNSRVTETREIRSTLISQRKTTKESFMFSAEKKAKEIGFSKPLSRKVKMEIDHRISKDEALRRGLPIDKPSIEDYFTGYY